MSVHPIAKAFIGGIYNSARPNYPLPAINKILSLSSTSDSLCITELGAGTGSLTRTLLSSTLSNKIGSLQAIEPSEGMRKSFLENVNDERVSLGEGTFEKTGLENGKSDVVVIGQAFHWVQNDEAALKEMARILKPGGFLVLIWNLEDRSTQWVAELRDVYEQLEAGTPQYRLGLWKSIYKLATYEKLFHPPTVEKYHRILETNSEKVVNRVLSKSYISILEGEERTEVVEKVREVVKRGNGKVWIDEKKDIFEYPYDTDMFVMQRK